MPRPTVRGERARRSFATAPRGAMPGLRRGQRQPGQLAVQGNDDVTPLRRAARPIASTIGFHRYICFCIATPQGVTQVLTSGLGSAESVARSGTLVTNGTRSRGLGQGVCPRQSANLHPGPIGRQRRRRAFWRSELGIDDNADHDGALPICARGGGELCGRVCGTPPRRVVHHILHVLACVPHDHPENVAHHAPSLPVRRSLARAIGLVTEFKTRSMTDFFRL
jgi:hypothetical protein